MDSEINKWFEQELRPHEDFLKAWLQSRFSSGVEIDDIVQEAFLRVIKERKSKGVKSPKALLFATARNLALDSIRHAKVKESDLVHFEFSNVYDDKSDIFEDVARGQELEMLTKAIQSLPDRCRQIFTLKKVYSMPQKEIAAMLGISEHTVSAQLTIGLRKCSKFMEKYLNEGKT